jgi:hypothetical protein
MAKVLITSALPYINGIKHLGNLAGSLLPADIHARYRRQIGDEVLFICATDEHGTPAELAAGESGLDVAPIAGSSIRSKRRSTGGSILHSTTSAGRHPRRTTLSPSTSSIAWKSVGSSRSGSSSRSSLRKMAGSCRIATSSALVRIAGSTGPAATNARTARVRSIRSISSSRGPLSPGALSSRSGRPATSS